MKLGGCLGLIIVWLAFVFGAAVILALPTMWLWNALVPDITKEALTPISFWQALGLNFLCGILFKSSSVSSSSESK